jgi:ABC-type multidrug transport system fused ATPase/permease subunit
VALAAALMLIGPLLSILLLWLVSSLTDEVLVAGHLDRLPIFTALYVAAVSAKLLLDYVTTRLDAWVMERIIQEVRVDLYRHVISSSPGSLPKYSVGDLLAHLSEDAARVEYLVYTGPLGVIADAASALFFVGFLLFLSWKLTVFALIAAPLLAWVSIRLSPRVKRSATIARRRETAWMSLAEERLGAIPVVHAFDAQARETARFAKSCDAARRADLRTVSIQAWMSLLIEAAGALGGFIVLGIGVFEIQGGGLTVGALVAFLGSVGSLYSPVRGLAKVSGRFQRAAAGAQRASDLLDMPSLVVERPLAKRLSKIHGGLEFRGVRFAYPRGAEILRGVSFRAEPGETVAVVGASGSGKSTLARLALRLYDPSAGAVLLDGTDIRDVTLESLRRAIVPVFQEAHLFRGSVADNIRYGRPDVSDESVRAAGRASHVEGFASTLRGGYSAGVGPRGTWLSGGQQQRIAVARALLRDAPILLLDEATASVDSETEELIQDSIDRLAGSRTLLIVAHRLSSLRRADRVIVIEGGSVIEEGTPGQLLRTGSRYHDLFAAQLGLETSGT